MGKAPKEILKEAREKRRLTQEDLAGKVGISHRQIQNYEEGKFPKFKGDSVKKIDDILGTALYEMIYEKEASPKVFVSHSEAVPETDLMRAVLSLTKSNEALVSQHSEILQANRAIAETNRILAEKVAESGGEEIPQAVEARFSDLLELIAELGVPNRWKSKKEGLATLSKLWHGKQKDVSKEGIHDGEGKAHK